MFGLQTVTFVGAVVSSHAALPTFEYFYKVADAQGKWKPSQDCGHCENSVCCIDPFLANASGTCLEAVPDCADVTHGYGSWYTSHLFPEIFYADGLQDALEFTFHPIIRNKPSVLDKYQVCALDQSKSATQSFKFVECLQTKQPYARHCDNVTDDECELAARADVWSCSQISELDMEWFNIETCFNGTVGEQLLSKATHKSAEMLQQVNDSSTESVWVLNGQPTCTMHTPESIPNNLVLARICELGISAKACVMPHTPQLEYFYTVGGSISAVYTGDILGDVWRRPGVKDGANLTFTPICSNSPSVMDRFQVCALHVGEQNGIHMMDVINCIVERDPERDCQHLSPDACDTMLQWNMWQCSQRSDLDAFYGDVQACTKDMSLYVPLWENARARWESLDRSSGSDAIMVFAGKQLDTLPDQDLLTEMLCHDGLELMCPHQTSVLV